jgi:hypothetical protein
LVAIATTNATRLNLRRGKGTLPKQTFMTGRSLRDMHVSA